MPRSRLVTSDESNPSRTSQGDVQEALRQAACCIDERQFGEAVAVCRVALHAHPEEASLYERALVAYLALCITEKSKAEYAALAEEFYDTAHTHIRNSENKKGINALISAIRLTVDDIEGNIKQVIVENSDNIKISMLPKENIAAVLTETLRKLNESHDLGLTEEGLYNRVGGWANELVAAQGEQVRGHSDNSSRARSAQLPDHVPDEQKYKPRQGVVEFLETGWPAPYIKAGVLSRPDLRRLDPHGAVALENWLKNPKHALPDHLRVPKKVELVDRELQDIDLEQARQFQRLASAAKRRKQSVGK